MKQAAPISTMLAVLLDFLRFRCARTKRTLALRFLEILASGAA